MSIDAAQYKRHSRGLAGLLQQVLALATRGGWQHRTPTPSPSTRTWDDVAVLLCKPGLSGRTGRLLFAILQGEGVPLTRPQEQWIAALSSVPGIEIFVWRESDLENIVATLTAKRCYT